MQPPASLPPFDDPVLGRVSWDPRRREWRFALALPGGHTVFGGISPEDSRRPLHEQGLDRIRARVRWIRDNEPALRSRMADRIYRYWEEKWYRQESDSVQTMDDFRNLITLSSIHVSDDGVPELIFDDGSPFEKHAIVLVLDKDCDLQPGPTG